MGQANLNEWDLMPQTPQPNEVRPVSGGYGLMLVVEYDSKQSAVLMRGHGSGKHEQWFGVSHVGAPVDDAAVRREFEEANARRVGCNHPACWCIERRK